MSNLPLKALVWSADEYTGEPTSRTMLHGYIVMNDGNGKFKVAYYLLSGGTYTKFATGFATIEDAKEWCWNHYNEKMQPYVKPSPTWVSVADRLPNKSGRYMVVHQTIKPVKNKSTPVDIDTYDENEKAWAFFRSGIMREVTHWMPIPEFSTMQNLHKGGDCE